MKTATLRNNNPTRVAEEDIPPFIMVSEKYVIGTPKGIQASVRTRDIPFNELAGNYDFQVALSLLSSFIIKRNPILDENELTKSVAVYLSAFTSDPVKSNKIRDYLISNGLVRILFTDDALRKKLDDLQTKQDTEIVYKTLSRYENSLFPSPDSRMDKVGTDFETNQPIFRYRK